ncbi:hypothetical protein MTO96_032764, partial [Rhipicephalus appendiculatus]
MGPNMQPRIQQARDHIDTCSFEKGICPLWVSSNCNESACFQARKVASMLLGPSYDHTSKSVDGWSAYAIKTTPNVSRQTASLTRRVKGPFCFTGWYHQSGTQVSTAMFILVNLKASKRTHFHDSRPDKYGRWQRVRYSEKRTGDFQISIRYYMERFAERGVFAVDDLTVDDQACTGGLLYLELKGNGTTAMLTSPRLTGRPGTQCLDFRYLLAGKYGDQTAYLLHVFLHGSYVFFSNHERTSGDTGNLISEILSSSSKITQCAEFWYIISGDKTELKVLTRNPTQRGVNYLPLWTQKSGASSEWQMGRIAVPHRNRVIFRAIVGPASTPAFVALDDIAIVHQDRCETFPKDSEALSASNIAYVTGSTLASSRGKVALQSPIVGPLSQPACFSFWYHMFGGRGASVKLTLEKSPSTSTGKETVELFLQRDRATADRWYNVQRTVSLDSIHNKMVFTISNAPSLRDEGVVALGPLQLTMGECDVLTEGQGYCDFEFDTCGWTADATWQRHMSIRPIGATDALSGPVNSFYALSAMQLHAPKGEALLTSPKWSGQSQPQCLEFWYEHDGSVYPDLQVIFRAKFGGDITQFVSLDDVVLRPEPCVHPAECDFNDGICGYVNQFQGNFQWLVGTGRYERPKLQPAVPRAKDITAANVSVTCYGKASDKAQPEVQSPVEMDEVLHWTTLNVPVSQGTGCQLAVMVIRGPGTNGTMAIASVKVTSSEP